MTVQSKIKHRWEDNLKPFARVVTTGVWTWASNRIVSNIQAKIRRDTVFRLRVYIVYKYDIN